MSTTYDDGRFKKNRMPVREYYKEAMQEARKPPNCPRCQRPCNAASNWYEVGRRIPSVFSEGYAQCFRCGENALKGEDALRGAKLWYCSRCQICICGRCKKLYR